MARAEWIKLVVAFIGKKEMARQSFDEEEQHYLKVSALGQKAKRKPSVFSGRNFKGVWRISRQTTTGLLIGPSGNTL